MFDPFSAPQSFTITTPVAVAVMTTNNTTATPERRTRTEPADPCTTPSPPDLTNPRASLFILLGLNDFVLIELGWRT